MGVLFPAPLQGRCLLVIGGDFRLRVDSILPFLLTQTLSELGPVGKRASKMCPQTLTSVEMGKKDPSEMPQGAGVGRAKLERRMVGRVWVTKCHTLLGMCLICPSLVQQLREINGHARNWAPEQAPQDPTSPPLWRSACRDPVFNLRPILLLSRNCSLSPRHSVHSLN